MSRRRSSRRLAWPEAGTIVGAILLGIFALSMLGLIWIAMLGDCRYPPKRPVLHPIVCDLVLPAPKPHVWE